MPLEGCVVAGPPGSKERVWWLWDRAGRAAIGRSLRGSVWGAKWCWRALVWAWVSLC